MIPIAHGLQLDERHIVESFMRASGPGGQNVNKVSTAVELRFDTATLTMPDDMAARLVVLAGRQLAQDGILIITSQKFRSQERNRADALEKLLTLLRKSALRPKRRIATKPTKASKTRRLDAKTKHAQTKNLRRKNPAQD